MVSATHSFTDKLIGYALTFVSAKYLCIRASKSGVAFCYASSLTPNEHTAIFYVMPHLTTPFGRVVFHLFVEGLAVKF